MNDNASQRSDEQAFRVAYLVAGYIRKKLTPAEHDELDQWVEASDENMRLFEELTDEKNIAANLQWMDEVRVKEQLKKAKEGLVFAKPKRRTKLLGYAIAASVILIAATVLVQQLGKDQQVKGEEMTAAHILPATPRVTLRLSDGIEINLSARGKGAIKEYASNIGDGVIAYDDVNVIEVIMHELSTATGGQYQVQLSDGTKVWLNASTKLTYPAVFNGKERAVALSGEAYFEVAKDKDRPFIVMMNKGDEVRVLGTHFNIQTYSDEPVAEVTLTEGRIAVNQGSLQKLMMPGDIALLQDRQIEIFRESDTHAKIAWKNNLFVFRDADITAIMRQVKRWYDVDIKYEGIPNDKFTATINRKEPLSKLLHLLELTGKIQFDIKDKVIHVHQ